MADQRLIQNDFVDLHEIVASIQIDMKYAGLDNFTGKPVPGYETGKCLLTRKAAEALKASQQELIPQGYSLLVFDCYRPMMAVKSFFDWTKSADDLKFKKQYYPNITKRKLISRGYIGSRSSHSKGSTVDISLVKLTDDPGRFEKVDMGSPFDFFDPVSRTVNSAITTEQQNNRLLLMNSLVKHGFRNYTREWWHYTLVNQPYPSSHFHFPVR